MADERWEREGKFISEAQECCLGGGAHRGNYLSQPPSGSDSSVRNFPALGDPQAARRRREAERTQSPAEG